MKKLVVFVIILIGAFGYIACGGSSNSMPTQPVVNTPPAGMTPTPGSPPPPTPTPY